ncbi:transposase, partial [Tetragenococcus halophilus]
FIMMNGETRQLLEIVANRQLPHLEAYFARYPREERAKVHYVVSDFYSPYASLVKTLFPNAQLVIDRFHMSQHIGRAFQQQRKQVMNTFHRRQKEYKHLK